MGKRSRIGLVAAFVTSLAAPSAFATDFGGNVSLSIGQKTFHKNDFDPIQDQIGAEIMTTWGTKILPVGIAADLSYYSKSGTKNGVKNTGTEETFALGARKGFMLSGIPVIPYAGAGIEYGNINAKSEIPGFGSFKVTATGLGIWADGGAVYALGPIGVGLNLRYDGCPTKGKVSGQTVNIDNGGFQVGLVGGYSF